jgi:hypothetical protein
MYERHGHSINGERTRLYRIWAGMRARCNNPAHKAFAYYGGRGIKVCEAWEESFSAFKRWAEAAGYRSDKSIDRVDNAKGYSPENCRWATDKMQARNKPMAANALRVHHDGNDMTLAELSRVVKIGYTTLVKRYKAGLTGDDLIAVPRADMVHVQAAIGATRNGNAKLTPSDVQTIRTSSESGAEMARRFKVSKSTVSMIRSGTRR